MFNVFAISINKNVLVSVIFLVFILQNRSFAAINSDGLIESEIDILSQGITTQLKIESLDDTLQQMNGEARQLSHEIRLQSKYHQQLENQLVQLQKSFIELDNELDSIRQIKINLQPLLLEMFNGLQDLVNADLPFQIQKRKQRLDNLHEMLMNSALSDAHKLERLLIAYQTEISFGNRVSVWQDRLNEKQEVIFLSVGRIGYYYLSLDGSMGAVWKENLGWKHLNKPQTKQLSLAITKAKNTVTPSLLTIPKAI